MGSSPVGRLYGRPLAQVSIFYFASFREGILSLKKGMRPLTADLR